MTEKKRLSQVCCDKANEQEAFREYAPFRYGRVALESEARARIDALRGRLDPIFVDIVDGGVEAAAVEAEAAVERAARSTIVRAQHDYRASINTPDCLSVSRVSLAATAHPIRIKISLERVPECAVVIFHHVY